MDFWDLTKLLVRRWYIALPTLVASLAVAVGTIGQVTPDYIATAYVQLVPPVVPPTPIGQLTPGQPNPWLGLGPHAIGNAANVIIKDQTVIDELKDHGYSGTYAVEMDQTSPLVKIEVMGDSERQSRETAERLVARHIASVAALQTQYGVPVADLVTARRLDGGTNVKVSDSKVKRAWAAGAGASVLLTVALTIAMDAWLRQRARRRDDAEAPLPRTEPRHPTSDTIPQGAAATVPPPDSDPAATVSVPADVPPPPTRADAGQPVAAPVAGQPVVAVAAATEGKNGKSGAVPDVTVTFQTGREPETADDAATNGEPESRLPAEYSHDATIVLPLAMAGRKQWPARDGESKQRR